MLAAGHEPFGPPSLDAWRERHPDLHHDDDVLAALREHFDEVAYVRVPYLHRWLGGPSSEALETSLVAAGALPAIGFRCVGRVRDRL